MIPPPAPALRAPEVVLGITGSIAAYKAGDVVRRLRECGCAVTCVLTKEAAQFVAPLTLQALSGRRAQTDLFSLDDPPVTPPPPAGLQGPARSAALPSAAAGGGGVIHTDLADRAQLLLIAPATANIIGKLAHGLADDLLTCLALATKAPVLLAPAMNVHMWQHATVRTNMSRLKALGYHVVGPTHGPLACGYEAIGHLADVEDILQAALKLLKKSPGQAHAAEAARPTPRAPGRKPRPASRRRKR